MIEKTTDNANKKPRTKPAQVRLNELMAAAQFLFLSQGVENTTISEIVERADVAKGTFYNYFDSKTEILQALKKRYTQNFLTALQQAIENCAPDDWLQRLRIWIITSVNEYVATYKIHDIVHTAEHHDRHNQDRDAIVNHLLTIIEGGIKAGLWAPAQPRLAALVIYSGVHAATDEIISRNSHAGDDFAHSVVEVCLPILRPVEKQENSG